jgi:hypothetical protein
METIRGAIFGMKKALNNAVLVLSVLMALGFCVVRAQQPAKGHANDFTSVEYFEPPHQTMMRLRLSGAEARPLTAGLLAIQQFKLETFDSNGVPEIIVKAPHCVYDTIHGLASSAGHLRLETADGSSHVEGDGFLWLQASQSLYISNNVYSVFDTAAKGKTGS